MRIKIEIKDIVIIKVAMREWNEVVGEKEEKGKVWFRKKNERGERLVNFCKENKMIIIIIIIKNTIQYLKRIKEEGVLGRHLELMRKDTL